MNKSRKSNYGDNTPLVPLVQKVALSPGLGQQAPTVLPEWHGHRSVLLNRSLFFFRARTHKVGSG